MADRTEQARARSHSGVLEDFIIDPWLALSFKRVMGDRTMPGVSWQSPGWVGVKHQRRLMAYKVRELLYQNAARHVMPYSDPKDRSNHREYGDGYVLVETVLAALKGETQEIIVPGAENFNEDQPDNPPAGLTDAKPDEQSQDKKSASLQDDLRAWADSEMLPLKLIEVERAAVKLGDGVYVLGWSATKKRPRLRPYEPDTYFPVLDEANQEDYPVKVHTAWELEPGTGQGEGKVRVHRITWELREGDALSLPWNDGPVTLQCFMSDGIYTVDKSPSLTGPDGVNDLTGPVEWLRNEDGVEMKNVALGIDFIPLVHIPNMVALTAHYGRSLLDSIAQVLDDIARADTDLQQASRLAAFPPLAVGKTSLSPDPTDPSGTKVITYGPGTAFEIGEGTLTAVDLSNGVTALITYVNHLLERLEVNARVPAGLLGRVKPSQVPSGVALALSFGPLTTMINEMRLVRKEKYRLLLRFAMRMLWLNGELSMDPPDHEEAELQFGTYLPVDKAALVLQVTTLLTAHAVSRATALVMLINGGLEIEDAAIELAQIQATDFEGANALLNATDDPQQVFDYLGLDGKPPTPAPIPVTVVPGAPAPGNGNRPAPVPPGA